MSLKGLRQYVGFDFPRFSKDKLFTVTGVSNWVDFNTKLPLGTRVEVVISSDQTPYAPSKDGRPISNLYEKLTFKIDKNINVPIGATVVPLGAVATVYGQYQNELSIRAADIKVISPSAPPASGHTAGGKGLG